MEGKKDEFTGKVKKAAGDIAGDPETKHDGQRQELAGKVEQMGEKVKSKASEAGDKLKR
jgi:uncharacterized protein YjbJ (UPF0337 family)